MIKPIRVETMTTKASVYVRYGLIDLALVGMACLLPALSHVVGLPLYRLNPMLALLLAGILLSRDSRNAILLAVSMPLVSCLVVGMPTAGKMLCMVAELLTVAALFATLSRRWNVLPAILTSILAAKGVYYALKAIILAPAVLVGTEWWMQVCAVVVWAGVFALLYKKLR